MSYQIIVREIKPSHAPRTATEAAIHNGAEQIYEQTVEVLDLGKLIAAVNAKHRKPRVAKAKSV